jgi:TP901 family phage tail tape measure protein
MSQSIQVPVTQVGLEQSIVAAMKRVGSSTQLNLGTGAKQINALSRPLGRITGQADEFSKSMAAANARVLAFGASAGIIAGVSTAMGALLTNTIKVEKSLIEIGSVLNKSGSELDKYGQQIFSVAKNTGQSFDIVAEGALELARQGLDAEDTLKRLNDALILSRLSGLDAKQSVEGLTAAFNSFKSSGETSATILNKLVAVSQEYAVSEKDLIEAIKRSASVADLAGVSFNELAAITTAIQQKTARGGAVIGNSLKTIFARIQDKGVLEDLGKLGIDVIDASGKVLSATDVLKNLAGEFEGFSKIRQADIAKKLGGVYQLDKLLAALKDLGEESSVFGGALKQALEAGNKAYEKNAVFNQSLSSLINRTTLSAQELGATLGKIGVTDSLKNVLGFFNSLIEGLQKILGEESALGGLVKGLVKGIGAIFAGPGLVLFGAIILKLSKDLIQFGFASLKIFFGIGKAAKEVQNVEGAISQILARNVDLQQQLFAKEGNRAAQLKIITNALIEQEAILRRSSTISSGLAAPLYNVGGRATSSGLRLGGNSAGGYMPAVAKESSAIKQGVGGARSGDKPVVMPNFNFGGGKKGTMVAHTGEYVVPNFNGSGGSAVFNRRMVQSMGLPSGAKKIGAAGGFVPNFARGTGLGPAGLLDQLNLTGDESIDSVRSILSKNFPGSKISDKAVTVQYGNENLYVTNDNIRTNLKRRSQISQELNYNSNKSPAALMLVPQNRGFNPNELNTQFAKKRNENGLTFDGFIGGIAGVNPNPNDAKFSSLTNVDNEIAEALSNSAFNILKRIEPGIKIEPKSALNPKNILNSVLSEGGAGAFGSFKGALFESVIKLVTKGKGQEGGTLDVDFNQGRDALEAIFGIQGKGYDYADFKNSSGQKDNFISQVMKNLPAAKYPQKAQKGMSAAGGYIPNFAKYVYDSDRIAPDKGATLNSILASKIKKNLIIGPAGSGKSTFAGRSGQFLSGIDDVAKATEIDILSGAARAKGGGMSKGLESIIASVNASGGKVSYLYAKNLEILARRSGRTSPAEGDLRSVKQLKGTKYAPLNQFDFLGNVKSKSARFNLIQAASGYIPNFVSKSREMGSGAAGTFFRLGKNKEGTDVGVKKFKNYIPSRSIEAEWLTSEFVNKYANIPGVFGPKNLSSFEDSKRKRAIRKEVVSDPLARTAVGSQKANDFGQKVLFQAFKARGLQIGDFHGSNYTLNKNAQDTINGMQNFPSDPVGAFSILRQIAASGGRIGAIDVGAANVADPARNIIGQIMARQALQKTSAKGFIPSFADPLKEAIGREMAAGVPSSQIYVDKNSSLKNAMNPMGLMVANRRDEPAGGFQGINRARREGADPMIYGAAGGFVPNYAAGATGPDLTPYVGKSVSQATKQINDELQTTLKAIVAEYKKQLKEQMNSQKALKQKNAIEKQLLAATDKELIQANDDLKRATKKGSKESIANIATLRDRQLQKQKEFDAIQSQQLATEKQILTKQQRIDAAKKIQEAKTTQQASAQQNATNLQAAVTQGARRSVTNPLGRVRDPNPAPGGNRDMLGTIFAVQGALSALTGATEGATGGLGVLTNGLSSAAGSATTALFASQGLSQAFGGAEKGVGKFLGKLGPYGAAAAFLYTGFNELTKYLDKTNVEVQKASESMLMVSEAASKAAINLSTLNPIQQERVRKRAEDVIEKSRTLEASTSGYNPYGVGSSVPTTRLATFEGVSDELKTGFEKIISESLAAGVSETELNNLITSRFQSGGKLTSQEIQDISKELNTRLSSIAEKGSPESIIKGLSQEEVSKLETMSRENVETQISRRGRKNRYGNEIENDLSFLQRKFDEAGVKGDIARQEAIRKTIELLRERADAEDTAEEEAVKQTNTAIAQDKLKNALAMAIAKARSFENDQLGQTLLSAQELGNLDEKGLRNIQDRIALREIDRKLADETSSIIQSQIDKAKEITANSEKALALEAKFQGLTEEDLRNPEILKQILSETNALLSQGGDLTKAEAEALDIKIKALIENNQLEKDSLKLNQQKTEQFKEQAKQLDLISQASKRALEAQSFDREIGTTRSINAGDLQVRALESSKLGASDSQVRQIDQQIAAIKENTVALEQTNAREKIFSDFKAQLQENNKITNEATKANIDNQIKEAKTAEQLQGLAGLIIAARGGQSASDNMSELLTILQKFRQDLAQQDESAKQARALAADETKNAGRIAPVIDALKLFERSLLDSAEIIDQKIQDIKLQQLTSISGRELIQGNYDIETLRMQQGQTPEEAARIARDRQNKSVSQLFNEEFGKTEEERALDMKKTIVDASVQFKNNMIEGIMGAVEGASSLKDGLRSAAYEFIKAINQRMISDLVDKVVGGTVQSGTGKTSGGLVGFLSGMFGMASGGMITGGSGTKDDIPAMLMGGEYVVNKKAVSKYGAQFFESLNNGTLMGYAKGGSVQKGPQGNFYTPGTFGQGAISGKRNLLDFATQTGTSGKFDQLINELGYQSVSLEPESSRLSVSGMRNSPMFDATQSAKGQAFDLYLQQYNAEREAKKAEKEQKKALTTQLLMLAGSAALGAVGNAAGAGAKASLANLSKDAKFLEKLGAAASGAFKGGDIGGGVMGGGLKNLFSGNFNLAFQSGALKELPISESGYGKGVSFLKNQREETDKILSDIGLPAGTWGEEMGYNPLIQRAIGGMIPSRSGIDTVPAMLSGGEFVMNRSAVQGIGASNLQSMNSGGTSITSEETSKELNEKLLAKLDELISSSGSTGNITINVAPSGQTTQENSQDPSAGRQQLARQIKDAVLQIINDEKRIGGTLRR